MFACAPHQEIELSAAMGRPEVGVAGSQRSNDLLQRETLPTTHQVSGAIADQRRWSIGGEHARAAVAEIDFGSLDLALADIFKPRRKDLVM